MDLVALNIQRGRDHGLPGYNAFRELCGLGRVETFQLLADLIPAKLVERLSLLYSHVDDIDLFVGGISEVSEVESLLGQITDHHLTRHSKILQVQHSGVWWEISSPDYREGTDISTTRPPTRAGSVHTSWWRSGGPTSPGSTATTGTTSS